MAVIAIPDAVEREDDAKRRHAANVPTLNAELARLRALTSDFDDDFAP